VAGREGHPHHAVAGEPFVVVVAVGESRMLQEFL
jgi:hypothetical protein